MQESEIKNNINRMDFTFPGFNIEIEKIAKYQGMRFTLEQESTIIEEWTSKDVIGVKTTRIINLYRSFSPTNTKDALKFQKFLLFAKHICWPTFLLFL